MECNEIREHQNLETQDYAGSMRATIYHTTGNSSFSSLFVILLTIRPGNQLSIGYLKKPNKEGFESTGTSAAPIEHEMGKFNLYIEDKPLNQQGLDRICSQHSFHPKVQLRGLGRTDFFFGPRRH